jgi:hypothetical protein
LSIALAYKTQMNFRPSKLLMMLAFGAATVSLRAQQTIIFSKPAGTAADKANSFMDSGPRPGNAKDFSAPRDLFKDYTPDNLGAPAPVIVNNQDPSVKEALAKRKNWTLLTPEQILGVQTPEQILGMTKPTDEKKSSLEEQYLMRESRTTESLATNGRMSTSFWREQANNPFEQKQQKDEYGNFSQHGDKLPPGNSKYFNQFLNAAETQTLPNEKQDSVWASAFAQPNQPKPDLEQIAAMERFRAMMEPSAPPEKMPVQTPFTVTVAPVRNPNLEVLPSFNPSGASVMPLHSDIGRPTGILPLPGVSRPASIAPTKRPEWQAQLPPWLRSGPPAHTGNF